MTTVLGFESIKILPSNCPRYDLKFKLIIFGDSYVGKYCFLTKGTIYIFNPISIPTIGPEIKILNIKIENQIVKLKIYDTGVLEKHRSIPISYFRCVNLVIITYAIDE